MKKFSLRYLLHIDFYWFFILSLCFYIGPFTFLIYSGELDLGNSQTLKHMIFAMMYLSSYIVAGTFLTVINNIGFKRTQSLSVAYLLNKVKRKRQLANKLATILGWISVAIIFMYYVLGGYKKIFLLGSNIDRWSYRIIGYDDTSRILTAFLEVARRIFMPFTLLVKMSFYKYRYENKKITLLIFITAGLLGAIVNLDRGPIFLYLVLFFIFYFFTSNSKLILKFTYFVFFIAFVAVVGSFVTFIQYNRIEFNINQIYNNSFKVLIDRILLDPVRMGELWAFNDPTLLNHPLYLKYSRLGALFGGTYIGTEFNFSRYVAPVGIFGDVWRNFGMLGAIFIGGAHGFIYKIISGYLKTCDFIVKIAVYFLLIIMILYLFYGGLFSQGPFALLLMIIVLAKFNQV